MCTVTCRCFSMRKRTWEEFPHVHQSDDRDRKCEAERNRRDVRRTDGHCQAIHESVSAAGCEGILRKQAAAQFSIETEIRRSEERRVGKECRSRWTAEH